MRCIAIAVLGACLCGYASTCVAMNAADYDRNGDKIISGEEHSAFVRDRFSPPLARFDANNNQRLEPDELAAVNRALEETQSKVADEESLFETDWPSGQPLVEFARDWETEDRNALLPKPVWQQWPIKIRNTHEDISHGVAAKDPKKASPADLAFTRDFSADNEVLVLKGAVMWPIHLNEPKTLLGVPSVALNKVSNEKDDTKDVDSMVLRFGLDLETEGPGRSLLYWRLNPTWTTDTQFDLDVRGLEVQVEPVGLLPGTGSAYSFWGEQVSFRWRGILHTEYGNVSDSAANTALIEGQSFTRIGLKLDTSFWLDSLERLALIFGNEYHFAVGGDMRDRKLFKTTLSYDIDPLGHFKVQTSYVNGDASAALENEETWTIGLGFSL